MNTKRGFAPIIILIIILAAAAVGGGGYYVVSKVTISHAPVKISEPIKDAEPVAKPSPTSVQSSKTYGSEVTANPSLGWPVKISATIPIQGRIQSFSGMVDIKVLPSTVGPGEFTLTASGFPASTDLHIYTHGYRIHEVKRTNTSGALIFILPSTTGHSFIIKDTPS